MSDKFPKWATMTTSDLRKEAEIILADSSYDVSLRNCTAENVDAVVKLAMQFADCRWGLNKLAEAIAEGLKK